jgi:protein CpxP
MDNQTPPPPRSSRPPMERALPPGTWWRNPEMVQKLSLNSDQQKKIEDIFQQHRLKLVDLDAALRKEEITLEPLMAADSPDEAKTLAQIDKVAQGRAELEKANARFLFGIRRVLTPEQWKKLQDVSRPEGGDRGGPPPQGQGRGGRGRQE